jgi:cell wall-associated NlpC family hydrolase
LGAGLKWAGLDGQQVVAELPVGQNVSIPRDACRIRSEATDPRIKRVLSAAARLLDTKYLWGGTTSRGIDCSGLVQTAFAAEGIHLPRDADQQAYLGRLTATRWYRDGLRPGDTLYFLGRNGRITHTALYFGDGQYLESVRPCVRYASFSLQDENYDRQRDASFCFARRLFD